MTAPNIYPCLRYEDAPDGKVAHAEMSHGAGLIMLGSKKDDFIAKAGVGVQCIYLAITDVDAHCARARAAGARIVRDLNDTDYGSREYCALDIGGHFWSFGTYWPKVGK